MGKQHFLLPEKYCLIFSLSWVEKTPINDSKGVSKRPEASENNSLAEQKCFEFIFNLFNRCMMGRRPV